MSCAAADSLKKFDLMAARDHGWSPLGAHAYHDCVYLEFTEDEMTRMVESWCNDRESVPCVLGFAQTTVKIKDTDVPCYCVFANETGDMWCEDFLCRKLALRYLAGEYDDLEQLYRINKRYRSALEARL